MSGLTVFSKGLDTPELIVLTDVPEEIRKQAEATSAKVIVRDGLTLDDYAAVSEEWTEGAGFDDIVVLDPRSADAVAAISRLVARRGDDEPGGTNAAGWSGGR